MILEGFEIENWSCIRKVSVSGLPPTGVIVIHGPNRRGKSSIVQALRACLMDYASTTTALKSWYPRGTGEKPVVSVSFQAGGKSYRITKSFGSAKSELASKTTTGAWKVETTSATEAHERTCGLVGGDDSSKGLNQLLWLTQAEFHLPEAKKFDPSIQAQLRGILGVLQTPLDDRFIERVKERWNVWYSGQRKAGKTPELKKTCKLAENLEKLKAGQAELQASETKFKETEVLLRQADDLEQTILGCKGQLKRADLELHNRKDEQRQSQSRIKAREQAEKDDIAAKNERGAALEEQRQRAAAAQRWLEHENAIEPAKNNVATAGRSLKQLEEEQLQRQKDLGTQRDKRRQLQNRANRVAAKLRALDFTEKLIAAQENLDRARTLASAIAGIETCLAGNPAPDQKSLQALNEKQQEVVRLQAERDAASMNLTLAPETGAAAAQLGLDGGPLREVPVSPAPTAHSVRRKAELVIDGWGRVELSRCRSQSDLDEIEEELQRCQDEFANAVAPFGVARSDPRALDQLIQREAEHRLKAAELDGKKKELKQIAPQGLEPLQKTVVKLQTQLKDVPESGATDAEPLPDMRSELDKLAEILQQQIESVDGAIEGQEQDAKIGESNLEQTRRAESAAKEALAVCAATANARREELDRLRTDEQISQRLANAKLAVENAETQLTQTALTDAERTIDERLVAAQTAVDALQSQIAESTRNYDVIKGRLMAAEGLHAQRASLAARVDELTQLTERESLERDAVDRLYALFEECREKRLSALMGPIQDRVLGWMRVLDIGDYQEVRFSDAFLPDKLLSRDGTAEFNLHEESTGAQEQIGMLTRLALGSILASPGQPAIAILDDPLTHCDVGRLNRMRGILRRAAEGDPNLNPPAGPLQIIVLTCHPEWFRDAGATVIDLENPDVMSRWPV